MYEIPELVEYSLILMLREKLERIEKAYPDKTWMKLFFSYTRSAFNEIESELISSADKLPDHSAGDMDMTNSEIISMLSCLKNEFLPEDYLFLKACLTKDEDEMGFLLEQALMIKPDDPYLFALSTVMAADEEIGFEKLIPIFNYYHPKSFGKGLMLFSGLMHINAFLEKPKGKQEQEDLEKILRNIPLETEMLASLMFHLSGKAVPGILLNILDSWKPEVKAPHPLYKLIRGILQYRLGNFTEAATLIQNADISSLPLPEWEIPSYQYMLSKALHYSGQTGAAILIWQEIAGDPSHYDRGTTVYFNTIFDLCRYYISIEDYLKARSILFNVKDAFREYLEESRGEEFFTLRGDICLGEGEVKEALLFYEKAFSIAPSGKIAEKIEYIRKVIG